MSNKTIIYVCHAMTGRPWNEVKDQSRAVKVFLESRGFEVIDPIEIENDSVSENIDTDESSIPNRIDEGGKKAWYGDKIAIRKAHVVLDITPELKSEGVLRELGYARFYLFKPIIRLYQLKSEPHMVTIFEDDAVVRSLEEAADVIEDRWGTWPKRIMWRIKMLSRSLPKFIYRQFLEFK